MELDLNKQTLTVYGKVERISVLANRLQALSGKQAYEFLSSRGVFLPRKINVLALRNVLNERIKTLRASELPKEYYETLENYKNFSEFQLFNLFATICDNKDDFKTYRLNLWKLIIINYEALNLNDGEINYLKNISKLQTEKLEKYFQYITSATREMHDTFDGLEKDNLYEGLKASASIEDVVDLGAKYGIDLPIEYDVDGFKSALREYLAAFDKLTMEVDSFIEQAGEMSLENFAIKNDIPLSFNMTKDKLIDYLFFILSIAEMPLTEVEKIKEPKEYLPLEFKVDLNAFNGDVPNDKVRIIYYDGCENDGLFNDVMEDDLEPVNEDHVEELVEEEKIVPEAVDKVDVVEEKDVVLASESSEEDNKSNAELLAQMKAGFAAQDRKERKELSFGDVLENPYYGNPKTKKLYQGPLKGILLTLLFVVIAGIGIFTALKFFSII